MMARVECECAMDGFKNSEEERAALGKAIVAYVEAAMNNTYDAKDICKREVWTTVNIVDTKINRFITVSSFSSILPHIRLVFYSR